MNKKVFLLQILFLGASVGTVRAQEAIDPDDAVSTLHQAVFNGHTVAYTATIGHQPVWDKDGDDLGKALSQNPDLKVLVQSGYYDGGCDYFNAKYNFWQIDRGGKFQDRFIFKGYRSGHMIYVRQEDLKQGNEDIRQFIISQTPKDGVAIKY